MFFFKILWVRNSRRWTQEIGKEDIFQPKDRKWTEWKLWSHFFRFNCCPLISLSFLCLILLLLHLWTLKNNTCQTYHTKKGKKFEETFQRDSRSFSFCFLWLQNSVSRFFFLPRLWCWRWTFASRLCRTLERSNEIGNWSTQSAAAWADRGKLYVIFSMLASDVSFE